MPNVDHIFNTPRQATFNPVVSTQVFPLPFPIYAASSPSELNGDFLVTVNSVVAAGYTISGTFINGVALDGSLSLAAGVSGVTVQVWSRRAPRTSQDLNTGGTVTPSQLQAMFDSVIASQRDIFDWLTNLQSGSPFIPVGSYLPTAGGTMVGDLNLAGDPNTALKAATKQYVDNKFGGAQTWGGLQTFNAGLLLGTGLATFNGSGALFNGAVSFKEQVLVDGANISWDMSQGPDAVITIAGNRTLIAPTLAKRTLGQRGYLRIIQDGTGGRTLTLDPTYLVVGDSQLRQKAGAVTYFSYEDIAGTSAGNGTILLFAIAAPASRVLLNTITASNSVSLQDTTSFTNAYRYYEIVIEGLVPVTDSTSLFFQPQISGAFQTIVNVAGVCNGSFYTTTNGILNYNGISNLPNGGLDAILSIKNAASATMIKKIAANVNSVYSGAITNWQTIVLTAAYTGSNAAMTGFQLIMSGGNIASGVVKVYGWN